MNVRYTTKDGHTTLDCPTTKKVSILARRLSEYENLGYSPDELKQLIEKTTTQYTVDCEIKGHKTTANSLSDAIEKTTAQLKKQYPNCEITINDAT